jgi:hypothetical protein
LPKHTRRLTSMPNDSSTARPTRRSTSNISSCVAMPAPARREIVLYTLEHIHVPRAHFAQDVCRKQPAEGTADDECARSPRHSPKPIAHDTASWPGL